MITYISSTDCIQTNYTEKITTYYDVVRTSLPPLTALKKLSLLQLRRCHYDMLHTGVYRKRYFILEQLLDLVKKLEYKCLESKKESLN